MGKKPLSPREVADKEMAKEIQKWLNWLGIR